MPPPDLRDSLNRVKQMTTVVLLLILLVMRVEAQNSAERSREEKFAGATAWQEDAALARKWREISGRFLFQRTCLSCHAPAAFTRTEWQNRLEEFPDENHAELLPAEFEDLTAMFPYGRMVANDRGRYQSLETFLSEHAPEQRGDLPKADSGSIDLLPVVGQKAPDFSIADVNGEIHSLHKYTQNRQNLILVFSRAHW